MNMRNNAAVFEKAYAHAYDYLYQTKDYEKECDFVEDLFNKFGRNVRTVLDLGCGTGGHAIVLAKRGYHVTGVDRSEEMLKAARRKTRKAGLTIDYRRSSIQDLKISKKFDAVISMFAVMSYQTENDDLALACKKARQYLKPGGIFVFDVWNGLAVMTDPPVQVVREVNAGNERILRLTEPKVDAIHHIADINFRVLRLNGDRLQSETTETHRVRFFYPQEIRYFLQVAGFRDIHFCPFLKIDSPLSEQDRDITIIAY